MTAEEARRILLEQHGEDWDARQVVKLVEELERLEWLLKFYQANALWRYGPPQTYTSGSTAAPSMWTHKETRTAG